MEEQKTTTYGDLKQRKVELQNKMEKGGYDREVVEEYRSVLRAIKWAEAWLLWTTVSLMLIVFVTVQGCHTVNGVGRDLSAWSSPYIEHQEK